MTEEDNLLLNNLKANTKQLFADFNAIESEKELLKEQVLALKKEIEILKQELFNEGRKNENLKMANRILSGKDEKGEAKQRINKLVREIDRCIALLNK